MRDDGRQSTINCQEYRLSRMGGITGSKARARTCGARRSWVLIPLGLRGSRRRNRCRIGTGLRSTLDSCCISRAFVLAVEPPWSIYEPLPQNACLRSPLPQPGALRLAPTTRKTVQLPSHSGVSAEERVCSIHTRIREPRFNATVGVQLLGHLGFSLSSPRSSRGQSPILSHAFAYQWLARVEGRGGQ
jgi:hypothetical protein